MSRRGRSARTAAARGAAAPPAAGHGGIEGVLVDTGALVALFDRADPRHGTVSSWLAACHAPLHTAEAVLCETGFFLPSRLKPALARLAAQGVITVHPLDAPAHARMAELFEKYRDQDPDWADIALVVLGETLGLQRIATLDVADFSGYRLHGRKRFRLELLA